MTREAIRFLDYLEDSQVSDDDIGAIKDIVEETGSISFGKIYDLCINGSISVDGSNKADSILDAVQCELYEDEEECSLENLDKYGEVYA